MRSFRRRSSVALACALLVSCGGGDKHASTPPTPIRWIAAGDSYSAGQGAPGARPPCDLTDSAMAPLARGLVQGDLTIAAFTHVACSDAVLDQVLDQVRTASAASAANKYNLVTFTAGGNDLGFAQVVSDCIGEDDLRDRLTPGAHAGCDITEGELLKRVAALGARLVPMYHAVLDQLAPRGALVVVGYPNLFADPDVWHGDSCTGVSKSDAAMLRRVATALDVAIASAATLAGATYVSLIDAFKDHELCGPGEPFINGIRLHGSFHPSAAGQQAAADLLAKALRSLYTVG